MNSPLKARPTLVWIFLGLSLASLLQGAFGCFQMLLLYVRPQPYVPLQTLILTFLSLALSTLAWIGLWRSRRWAWILAILLSIYGWLQEARVFLSYAAIIVHNVRFMTGVVLGLINFALLLSRPVREFFLNQGGAPRVREVKTLSAGARSMRIALYFLVAVAAPIVVSAYTMALMGGQKLGGSSGFLLFLLYGFPAGAAASLLFAITLTLIVRGLNPARVWQWILVGGLLAPVLMSTLTFLGERLTQNGSGNGVQLSAFWSIAGYVFWGPMMLNSLRYIAPIDGILTAWICSAMYPWSFAQSPRAKRAE